MQISLSEDHIYTVDGKHPPGVTTIIGDVYGRYPYPEGAAERGHHVHLATQLYDEGDLDTDTLDPVVGGYLEGWKRFRDEMEFTPTQVEMFVYNETYGYCGTLDRLGTFGDKPNNRVILDIKSGVPEPWHSLQLWAYSLCLEEPHQRFAVYLSPKGKYKLIPYNNREDRSVWLSTVTVYRWRLKNGC
jgi:hypothetical protein